MTTTVFDAAPTNNTDIAFRDWGSKFSAALAAVGMVKTADSGQINWATVVAPTALSQKMGYEIWRFNDALQATHPLFMKFEYGGSANSPQAPAIWISMGKGSNGSGVLTSIWGGQFPALYQFGWNQNAAVGTWYMSSMDGSALCFSMAPAILTWANSNFFTVERMRTPDGTPQGLAFAVISLAGGVSTGTYNQFPANYGSFSGQNLFHSWPLPSTSGSVDVSLAGGGPAPLAAPLLFDGIVNLWQSRAILRGMKADLPALTPITVPNWGTYLPLGAGGQNVSNNYWTHALAWF